MERQRGQLQALLVKAFSSRPHTAVVMTGLLVLTFVVYSPALKNNFVNWDDDVYVLDNARIQSLDPGDVLGLFVRPYYANYIPLTLLSHAIDYAFWKSNPWGHHLTNILLHCLNTVWVFILSLIILVLAQGSPPMHVAKPAEWIRKQLQTGTVLGGTAAALLFAVHPLRVESVSWVSDRKDLLCAAFLLPSTIAYLVFAIQQGERRRSFWLYLSLFFFVCAVLCKPVGLVAPVMYAGLDLLLFDMLEWRKRWRRVLKMLLPFLLISILIGGFAVVLGESGKPNFAVRDMGQLGRWLLPFFSLTFYLEKLVWPARLLPVYPTPDTALMLSGAIIAVLITFFVLIMLWRRRPAWLLAWLGYVLFIAPTFAGIGAGVQPWADRYTYLAAVSLCVLCGGGFAVVWAKAGTPDRRLWRIGLIALPLIIVAGFALSTVRHIRVWRDSESLWSYAIANAPAHPTPYNSLGAVYADRGEYDRAMVMYQRAIDLDAANHRAYTNLAVLYGTRGDTAKAAALFITARRLRPDYVEAYTGLGNLYLQRGHFRDAITEYDAALSVDPALAKAWFNKGLAYYQLGIRDSALIMFETTMRFQPRYTNAYLNAAVLYNEKGDTQSAVVMFTKAARLGSPDAQRFLRSRGIVW
jgi:tetratricopeptide (TPR) repeat protein